MFASRLTSRSPVWLRKIPSTVSGSQGSRRGLRPAARFAFPLCARLNITLRARPCQELFSESFSGRPAGRGAPRLGGLALRGDEFGIIRAPGAPGAGNPPAHRMPTTPARRGGRGLFAFAKLLTERIPAVPPDPAFGGDSLPKEERPPPGPPAFRAGNPLCDRPGSILSMYLYRDMFSSDCRRCA